jgi:hypothetical protein
MLKQQVSAPPSAGPDADIIVLGAHANGALRADFDDVAAAAPTQAQGVRDQLAREVAEIEAAIAALRQAEPALESWTHPPATATATRKPRPVWVLIGVLWLSTALVTAGAVVAIATLAG